jgi:septal ring factor EnvC (AmiA/AmiB activator)
LLDALIADHNRIVSEIKQYGNNAMNENKQDNIQIVAEIGEKANCITTEIKSSYEEINQIQMQTTELKTVLEKILKQIISLQGKIEMENKEFDEQSKEIMLSIDDIKTLMKMVAVDRLVDDVNKLVDEI